MSTQRVDYATAVRAARNEDKNAIEKLNCTREYNSDRIAYLHKRMDEINENNRVTMENDRKLMQRCVAVGERMHALQSKCDTLERRNRKLKQNIEDLAGHLRALNGDKTADEILCLFYPLSSDEEGGDDGEGGDDDDDSRKRQRK